MRLNYAFEANPFIARNNTKIFKKKIGESEKIRKIPICTTIIANGLTGIQQSCSLFAGGIGGAAVGVGALAFCILGKMIGKNKNKSVSKAFTSNFSKSAPAIAVSVNVLVNLLPPFLLATAISYGLSYAIYKEKGALARCHLGLNLLCQLDNSSEKEIIRYAKRINGKGVLPTRLTVEHQGDTHIVILNKDNTFCIQKELIGKGTSKDVYRGVVYNERGQELRQVAINVANEGVHSREIEIESEVGQELNIPQVNKLIKILNFQEGDVTKSLYISPLYDGTMAISNDLTFKEKVAVAIDVVRGIQAMHQNGYIHCDIHEGNIFVHQGHGIVGDLGAIKRQSDAQGNKHIEIATKDNVYGLYEAPECLGHNNPMSTASDVFALGRTLKAFFKDTDGQLAVEFQKFADFSQGNAYLMGKLGNESDKAFLGMQARVPKNRPSIEIVLEKLLEIQNLLG